MKARRGDQGAQAAQEGARGHVRERGASAGWRLEVNPKSAGINRQEGKDERASH